MAAAPPRQGRASPTVIAAFSGVLFVFTAATWPSASRSPRGTPNPQPDAIYGNNLAQQITSTFDVVICALSLAILVAMLFTGPWRATCARRETRVATAPPPKPPSPEPPTVAAPTTGRPSQPSAITKIVRLKEDSTTVIRLHRRRSSPRRPLRSEFSAASRRPTRQVNFPPRRRTSIWTHCLSPPSLFRRMRRARRGDMEAVALTHRSSSGRHQMLTTSGSMHSLGQPLAAWWGALEHSAVSDTVTVSTTFIEPISIE